MNSSISVIIPKPLINSPGCLRSSDNHFFVRASTNFEREDILSDCLLLNLTCLKAAMLIDVSLDIFSCERVNI